MNRRRFMASCVDHTGTDQYAARHHLKERARDALNEVIADRSLELSWPR